MVKLGLWICVFLEQELSQTGFVANSNAEYNSQHESSTAVLDGLQCHHQSLELYIIYALSNSFLYPIDVI